jgi:glycosyltransferase involved in cell wall biosynthesis
MDRHRAVWPIDEKAARPPEGWTGWPEGKRFALVLTHDVETVKGMRRSMDLADLDENLGFRSSFNFVAEEYDVTPGLREYLTGKGFEVGVHGLDHKGTLYRSRKQFLQHADRINAYLKEWRAVGFRSPSMHHNLDWIHDLHIEYDASTFDTDPFEPQPDGMGTIFPFHVNGRPGGKGYVELPYTLAQDFTLFIIMREQGIDTWKKKLDWIAEHGGMALLISHPDYMNFNEGPPGLEEYPAHYYGQLLKYIRDKYEGQYWNPLPKEMARFWAERYRKDKDTKAAARAITEKSDEKRKSPIRVCMLAYTFYETDGRVKRYAEALAGRGDHVDVIALRREGQSEEETINGVRVFRIQKRIKNEKRKIDYATRIAKFLFRSAFFLTKRHLRSPFDVIHVHSIPDFEVFAALIPRLMGAKIILDIHDIVPEFYASKFNVGHESAIYKLLIKLEKVSASFADHVIIANHLWYDVITSRSVGKDKCTVMLNYPDTNIFNSTIQRKKNGKFVILYPGTLNWHQGVDIAVKAFARIADQAPDMELHIIGEGPSRDMLFQMVTDLRLKNRVFIKDMVPQDEIGRVMAAADLGIVPKRANSFGNEAFSTKILEFMALGVPVIVSDTKIDKYYFNEASVKFFKAEDEEDLARCMLALINAPDSREQLVSNAMQFIQGMDWETRKHEYLALADRLSNNAIKATH